VSAIIVVLAITVIIFVIVLVSIVVIVVVITVVIVVILIILVVVIVVVVFCSAGTNVHLVVKVGQQMSAAIIPLLKLFLTERTFRWEWCQG
jgi:hypothetical protein